MTREYTFPGELCIGSGELLMLAQQHDEHGSPARAAILRDLAHEGSTSFVPEIVAETWRVKAGRDHWFADFQLEQRLVGTLLSERAQLPEELEPWHFIEPVLEAIYRALVDHRWPTVSLVTIADHFRDRPDLEGVGGTAYLGQLGRLPTDQQVDPVVATERLIELAQHRALVHLLQSVLDVAHAHDEALQDHIVPGAGRNRAHLLAMDLAGLAQRVLVASADWV